MSPEVVGIIIGLIFIVPTIYVIEKRGYGRWAWPIFLVTLPIYYMLFGLLALDASAILQELLYGVPYIITGLVLWKVKFRFTHLVLALAWLSHGFYDYYHDLLFVNPGVFSWYPAFCAVVDIAVGAYLLLNAARYTPPGSKRTTRPGRAPVVLDSD